MATIVVGVNSYISPEQLTAYATDRGVTLTKDLSVLIMQAMDYLESLQYKGFKTDKDQPLQWPRKCVYIDCQMLDDETIPQLLKDAEAEVAMAVDAGNSPISTVGRAVKRRKVDVIEVEYMDRASSTPTVRSIGVKLNKLLVGGGNSGNFINVYRA